MPRHARDELGEGPIWSPAHAALFWVDIFGQRLWSLHLTSGDIRSWAMPERIGWVVPRAAGSGLLAGFKSGVKAIALDPFEVAPFAAPEADRPHNRLNDAKVDAAGRLWFGSKDDRDREASGALYRLEAGGQPARVDDGYRVTNGPAFSPDGRWLYHNDSGLGRVYRFSLAADGAIGDRRVLIQFQEEWGSPDGMTTDADGCLWIAHWGGARVSRFDPDGALIHSVALPATNITSCAFAGEGLDRLFVTSARVGAEDEPDAGALFQVDAGVRGLPPTPFPG